MTTTASATRTIKFINKGGTYTAIIMSPSGDLIQEYDGDTTNLGTVSPDFSVLKPALYFVCTSSRVAEGIATPTSINFYFNGALIEWSGNQSTGTHEGLFEKISPSDGQPYYGIRIVQNIVRASNFASATIKMDAAIGFANSVTTDRIQASYTIPIQKASATSYRVTIVAGDDKNFVITEKKGTCILKAMVYQGSTEITENVTYKWQTMKSTGWEDIMGETAQTLTVQADNVWTYTEFRVVVTIGSSELSDIQGVLDATDPYEINPNPNPSDETITEDGDRSKVTYTPIVVKRGSSGNAMPGMTFYFIVRDAAGVILNKYQDGNSTESETEKTTANASSYDVTLAQCQQAGGDVALTIITADDKYNPSAT